jgi:hypothetical protein
MNRFLFLFLASCGGSAFTTLEATPPASSPDAATASDGGVAADAGTGANVADGGHPITAHDAAAAGSSDAVAPDAASICSPVPTPGPAWACGSQIEQGYYVFCVVNSPFGESEEAMPPTCRACMELFTCECLIDAIKTNVPHPCGTGVVPSCTLLAKGEVSVTCP